MNTKLCLIIVKGRPLSVVMTIEQVTDYVGAVSLLVDLPRG